MTNEVTNETENSLTNDNPATDNASAANSAEVQATPASNEDIHTTEEGQKSGEMDFGAILMQFEQEQTIFHTGELVNGKVVGISDRGVLIDFGYKSEGVVPIEEFTSFEGEVVVKQGDEVEVVIRSMHSGDSFPILSRHDAVSRKSWGEIEKAFNE